MKIKDIELATEMVKDIPGKDVLVPLQMEEDENLTPYPQVEYDVLIDSNLSKLIRNVNNKMADGWHCDGGVQVVSTPTGTRYYQSIERRVVRNETTLGDGMEFLENEPDLYEDVKGDAGE